MLNRPQMLNNLKQRLGSLLVIKPLSHPRHSGWNVSTGRRWIAPTPGWCADGRTL